MARDIVHNLKLNETAAGAGWGTYDTTDYEGWLARDRHHRFEWRKSNGRCELTIDGLKRPSQHGRGLYPEEYVKTALESFLNKRRGQPVWHPITEKSRREKRINQSKDTA